MPVRAAKASPPSRRDANTNRERLQTLRARHHRFAKAASVTETAPIIRKGGGAGSSRVAASGSWRMASLRLTTADSTARTLRDFKAALRAMKWSQQLIRQSASLLRQGEAEAQRRIVRPTRPGHTSRAALWRWYKARGLSWERFVADHGPG